MTTKTFYVKATTGVLLLALMPISAMAQQAQAKPISAPVGNFCENLETIKADMLDKVGSRGGEAASTREERQAEHEAKKAERLAELEEKRAEADEKRAEVQAELEEKASTDAQKAAVAEFVATVESLVDARRVANDAAIEAFEAAVAAIVADVEGSADDFENSLRTALEAAFTEAEQDCDGNEDDARGIAVMFRNDLKNVRAEFQAERQAFNFKEELEAARATRKAAHEAAQSEFQTGLAAAKETLRASFAPAE